MRLPLRWILRRILLFTFAFSFIYVVVTLLFAIFNSASLPNGTGGKGGKMGQNRTSGDKAKPDPPDVRLGFELLELEVKLWKEYAGNSTSVGASANTSVRHFQIEQPPNIIASGELMNKLPFCPPEPPKLLGRLKQSLLLMHKLRESEILRKNLELLPGGCWRPSDCLPQQKVAIIVPFRDRRSHLNRLLAYLTPILQRQLLNFVFIVTEQYGSGMFNKGRIMNAAFLLAEQFGVDCVIFHDVDLFPQDDRNVYNCSRLAPRHLGAYVNTLGYELWYNYIAGGVLAITPAHFRLLNGFSNLFWAWGGEDDDMGYRILAQNLSIDRPDPHIGRFTMLKHAKRTRAAPTIITDLLKSSKTRWKLDGLAQELWQILKVVRKPLYYHIYVDVGHPPKQWKANSEGNAPKPVTEALKPSNQEQPRVVIAPIF